MPLTHDGAPLESELRRGPASPPCRCSPAAPTFHAPRRGLRSRPGACARRSGCTRAPERSLRASLSGGWASRREQISTDGAFRTGDRGTAGVQRLETGRAGSPTEATATAPTTARATRSNCTPRADRRGPANVSRDAGSVSATTAAPSVALVVDAIDLSELPCADGSYAVSRPQPTGPGGETLWTGKRAVLSLGMTCARASLLSERVDRWGQKGPWARPCLAALGPTGVAG